MLRCPSAMLLGAALLLASAGCRSTCSSNRPAGCGGGNGWFSSNTSKDVPCTLAGASGRMPAEGCYDAITGQPVPCPPSAGGFPGGAIPLPAPGGGGRRPDELPFPETIPPAGVPGSPFAPPSAAPGTGLGLNTKGGGTTTKGAGK